MNGNCERQRRTATASLRDMSKRCQVTALVRPEAYMVREVRVLFRHAFSGL
jgi:hypothetical protein